MLTALLHEFVLQAIGFAIAAAIAAAWRFVRRFPALLVAMGVWLLATAASLAAGFSPGNFRTEGSPAGTIAFVVVGSIIVVAGAGGLFLFFHGLVRLGGEADGAVPLRLGVALASAAIVAGAAVAGFKQHRGSGDRASEASASVTARQKATARRDRYRPDHDVVRRVEVRDAYALQWKEKAGAPALAMRIPLADLRREGGAPTVTVFETVDGPRSLDIAIAEVLPTTATMQLLRDDSALDDELYDGLKAAPAKGADAPPQFLWAETGKGAWRVLGFDCGKRSLDLHETLAAGGSGCHEPKWLERRLPSLFGLEHVRVAAPTGKRFCRAGLRYRGRPVIVFSEGACFGENAVASLMAAVALLDRMEREVVAPAPQGERLARARASVERCESAQGKGREPACRHALALVRAEISAAPVAASLLLRALQAVPDARSGDRAASLDAAVQALEAAGRDESREMLQAHAMRLEEIGQSGAERDRARSRASLEVVLTLAPKLLEPDDPYFEKVQALMIRARLHPTEVPRRIAVLEALEEKARAARPGSEIATRTRYNLCRERAYAAIQRDTLAACAEHLLETWQARIAARTSFEAFGGGPTSPLPSAGCTPPTRCSIPPTSPPGAKPCSACASSPRRASPSFRTRHGRWTRSPRWRPC